MKKCAYCGRSNDDSAKHCRECGSAELSFCAATPSLQQPNNRKAGIGLWLTASILMAAFLFATVFATLIAQRVFHLPGFSGYVSALVIACWLPLPLWLLVANLLCAPLMRLLGMVKYYSPLFLVTGYGNTRIYLHGATLYDYLLNMRWRERGTEARLKTLNWYLEGLLGLVQDVESGLVPQTARITGTSYFFSANRARRLGFTVEESRRFSFGGFLTYPTQFLTYSFAKGRLSFPNMLHAKRASITGERLLEQKGELETLLKKLRGRTHTSSP